MSATSSLLTLAFVLAAAGLLAPEVAASSKLYDAIYTKLNANACIRLLSADGEAGCSTARTGATGILYRIQTPADLAAFADLPEKHYVALISQEQLIAPGAMDTLTASSHCAGILVYNDDFATANVPWSPDSKQPNAASGLPYGSTGFTAVNWNSAGTGIHWENTDFPVFLLNPEDEDTVFNAYTKHNLDENNQVTHTFPLAAVDLNAWMHGAKDVETCMRRSYCDPLGSRTPYGTLRPLGTAGTSPAGSATEVVMLAAAADSLAWFHPNATGADADMSGAIALLGAARVLGNPENAAARNLKRNILFTLFQGEAFGYIGSSRMFYDMRQKDGSVFPTSQLGLTVDNITAYIEAKQLLKNAADEVYAFYYQPSTETGASPQAGAVLTAITAAATADDSPLNINEQTNTELPPASLRAILQEIKVDADQYAFPGIVLTDHDKSSFTNTFYHSRFDDQSNIGSTLSATKGKLCRAAALLARSAWALADDVDAATVPLNTTGLCEYVDEILDCITVNASCSLAVELTGAFSTGPLNRYVGVFAAGSVETGTQLLYAMLGDALASDRDQASCSKAEDVAVPGTPVEMLFVSGRCALTSTYFYDAVSPAFDPAYSNLKPLGTGPDFHDGRDPRWSTWTESRWDSLGMRLFVVDSPRRDAATLGCGIAFLVVSLVVVGLLNKYTGQLVSYSVASTMAD